jgi:hypothetical protein
MNPLSASDVFLTVAIMSATFLTEVGSSFWLECFERSARSVQPAADARSRTPQA